MRYLLDTHVLIWYFEASGKLNPKLVGIIKDSGVQACVSVASLWEFAIKYSTGKLKFKGGLSRLYEQIRKAGFILLPVKQAHLEEVIDLPFIHRDPFDRLLVAAAKSDNMTILTADENIHKYDVMAIDGN